MLGADVAVAQLQRLTQRQLEHLLGAGRERDVPGGCLLALTDDLLDLLPYDVQGDPERLQRLGGDALALVDETEQDVLGADVVVVEHARFFLRKHHDSAGAVGKPFEHGWVAPRYRDTSMLLISSRRAHTLCQERGRPALLRLVQREGPPLCSGLHSFDPVRRPRRQPMSHRGDMT